MGEVHRAWDEELGRAVAIKRIRSSRLDNSSVRQRFLREAKSAAQLTHPAIVHIYHIVRHEGEEHIVMELVEGESLGSQLARGPLPWETAVPLFQEISEALAQAHEHGIVHRDLKPDNVMVTVTGHAKILDFGLAKSLNPNTAELSASGVVMGTLHTMSPEQARGEEIDHRTDLFSLGAMLYHVLTGITPFRGDTPRETLGRVCAHHPPTVRSLDSEIPPELSDLITGLLQKNRAHRPQSAAEVAQLLSQLRGGARSSSMGSASQASAADVPTVMALPSLLQSSAPSTPGLERTTGLERTPGLEPTPAPEQTPEVTTHTFSGKKKGALFAGAAAVGLIWWASVGRNAEISTPAANPSNRPVTSSSSQENPAITLRPSVAVLGLDPPHNAQDGWIATALSEMLFTELATGGQIRVVGDEEVARVLRELKVQRLSDLDQKGRSQFSRTLGVDYLVWGVLNNLADGSQELRIDLRFYDAAADQLVVTNGTMGGTELLFQGIDGAVSEFRTHLGIGSLTEAQATAAKALLPKDPKAARFYTEGLSKMRVLDAPQAIRLLQEASQIEPDHPMPYAALADAWFYLGAESKARQAAEQALENVSQLPETLRPRVIARSYAVARRWEEAVDAYTTLFNDASDDIDLGLHLAEAQMEAGTPPRAAKTLDDLAQLAPPLGSDPRIDLLRTQVRYRQGDLSGMLEAAERAVLKSRNLQAPLLIAQALLGKITALQESGKPGQAQEALEEARSLFLTYGDWHGAAKTLEQLAHTAWAQGNLKQALHLFEKARQDYTELGSTLRAASAQVHIASVKSGQGNLQEALETYALALQEMERAGDLRQQAAILNNMGAAYMTLGSWQAAKGNFQLAGALFEQLEDLKLRILALTNIAEIAYIQGELETAKKGHQETLTLNTRLGDKEGIAYDKLRLGKVYAAQGDLHAARAELQESLEGWVALGDSASAAQVRMELAILLLLQGQPDEAVELARQSEEILRNDAWADQALLARSVLVRTLLAQGQLDGARKEAARLELAASSEDARVRLVSSIVLAQVLASRPEKVPEAIRRLDQLAAEASAAGYVEDSFEARLAAGEIEMATGETESARTRLTALERETNARGYGQIAGRAAAVRGAAASSPSRGLD